ncbi:MAG: flagellar type III secretion system pore protein FliP [Deltaproteobacteria bacterium]|nr:flagellar type III secretion system pore protein FliP [Deltaproteobacteria bacterium]
MSGYNRKIYFICAFSALVAMFIVEGHAWAQDPITLPTVRIGFEEAESPQQVSTLLQIIFLMTVLSLAPAILVMMTSFTRFAIVLAMVRQALGTQNMPPTQIIIGLALLLTFFLMSPVYTEINKDALQPYLSEEISQQEALDKAVKPIRAFMLKQTRKKDIALFMDISGNEKPKDYDDVPTLVLVSAFSISELKTAFQIGFIIYIPFLVIDMVTASVLLSMGMMMLPPFMVSLPFKLMLFVLVDGWNLLAGSLIKSFG